MFPLIRPIQNHEKTCTLTYVTLRYVYIFQNVGKLVLTFSVICISKCETEI